MPSVCFSDIDMTYYDYDLGRVTNNFNRYTRLSDLLEEDRRDYLRFSSMSPYRRRYSSTGSSSSSMDHLWELYPHRLLEAGLSRYADSSTILTEDTDSFIIGQRVWVGGTKPGKIAFIGETQFAPGEWAGIVLDEPIGKNDGAVAGMRYFQCEPKKGVFSRLTRLTRQPLEVPHSQSVDSFSTPPANGIRSPVSPTGSTRSLLKSPMSHHASNTSLASMSTSVIIDYRIGDRVIIKSSQGSKVGTVRFIGYTEFAPGEWVGVELDDPRGKNDGSVEGKRYFTCQPNFGLFAPVGKVSKSPSKIKPSSCAVHNSGLPPSGLRRAGSKESMTSAASSIRRDQMKEKQQHIEQLLKERDLERQEFTKAASQAEEAEQQLVVVKKEFEAYRAECEVKLQEHLVLLSELKKDRTELLGQIDDEKKKNEDLLFKFEEAAILKSDVESALEKKIKEIDELQKLLDIERVRADESEKNANKLFEAEENLIKANEDIEKLKIELDNLSLEHKSLKEEEVLVTDQTELLEKELEITKKQLVELNTIRNSLSQELTTVNIESAHVKQSFEDVKQKLVISEKELVQKNEEISHLNNELQSSKKQLSEIQKQTQELQSDQSKQQADLSKELEKLKMEISSKTFDTETANEELRKKQDEIVALQKNLEEIKQNYEAKINETIQVQKENTAKLNEELKQASEKLSASKEEILKLSSSSEDNTKKLTQEKELLEKELEKIKLDLINSTTNSEGESSSLRNKIKENEDALENYEKQIKSLKEELDCLKKSSNSSNSELQNQLEQIRRESSKLIESLQNELKMKNEEIDSLSSKHSKLEQDLQVGSTQLENVETSLTKITQEFSESKEQRLQLDIINGDLRKDLESLQRKLEDVEMQKNSAVILNSDLKNQVEQIKQESSKSIESLQNDLRIKKEENDSLSSELSKLEHDLGIKSTILAGVESSLKSITEESSKMKEEKQQLDLDNGDLKRSIESLQKSMECVELQKKQMYEEIQSLLNSSGDNSAKLEEMRTKLFDNQTLLDKTKTEYEEKLQNLARQQQEKDIKLKEQESQVLKLEKDLLEAKESFEKIDNSNKRRIEELLAEINELKDSHVREIDEQQKNVNIKEALFEQTKKEHNEQQQISSNTIQELSSKLEEKVHQNLELEKRLAELSTSTENVEITNKQKIEELNKEIETIKQNHASEIDKVQKEIAEKESIIEHHLITINTIDTKMKENTEKSESYLNEIVESHSEKIAFLNKEREEYEKTKNELMLQLKEHKELNDELMKTSEKEVNELKNTIEKMTITITEISSENDKSNQQLKSLQDGLEQKNTYIDDLKKLNEEEKQGFIEKVKELEEQLEKITNETSEKISDLNNINEESQTELEKKNKELEEINLKFKEYVESNKLNSNDKEQSYLKQITSLESQMAQLKIALEESDKHKQNVEKEFNEKCTAFDNNSEKIKNLTEKLKHYEEKLKIKEEEKLNLQRALESSDNTSQEKDDQYKKLHAELQIINEKCKSIENAFNEEKLKNNDLIKGHNEKEETVRNDCIDLTNKLQIALNKSKEYELQKNDILAALQKLQFTQKQKNNLIDILSKQQHTELHQTILSLNDDYVDEAMINKVKQLEGSLEKYKSELNEERKKLASQSTEMYVLEQRLNSVSSSQQNHVRTKPDVTDNSSNSNNNEQCDYQQLLEDKLLAENQVKFLNSIIVDMQKKNEEQKMKIEILESGYSPAAADELNLLGFSSSSRQQAPRVYCDICDCFDLHETEDCPKQMSEDMPPPPPPAGKIKKRPEPRPYCELCEVFGHDTEECPEDQTF